MNNERLEELAALHALGLDDEAGRKELRDAETQDRTVKLLVNDFAETATSLAHDVPQITPPPHLKQDILHQLPTDRAESNIVAFPPWFPYAVAACFMALGIVQTLRVIQLKKDLNEYTQNLEAVQVHKAEDEERKSLAELRMVPLQATDPACATASITVAWNSTLKEGVVTLQNLPPAPAGHDYELWVLDPKSPAPLSAGLVKVTTASRHFTAGSVSTSSPGFAVSLEPSGGMPAPTGPILFAAAPRE